VTINGKRREEHALARGRRHRAGRAPLDVRFAAAAAKASDPPPPGELRRRWSGSASDAFKKAAQLHRPLSASPNLETLKRNLVDLVVELAGPTAAF